MSEPSQRPDRAGMGTIAASDARPSVSARPSDSAYPRSKRALDIALGSVGLLAFLPILAAIRVAMIATGDRGPFLFRATRIGERGLPITVLKIRTMAPNAGGLALTSRDDARVTQLGRFLRRTKLDELPQLWNVLRGQMALVGPRPEDPSYVDMADPVHRRVFVARPGITGLAQLAYRHEADLLEGADADRVYRESILPAKLRLDSEYLERRSVRLDLQIIGRTVVSIVAPGRRFGAS